MTAITNTVSTFIDSQLPEFIRENDPNFGAFLKAYYQWMETSNDSAIITQTKSLLSYKDIDSTTDQFIQYYINDFLPNFPNQTLLDKRKLIKTARNFYQKKGSIESIQFLFRVLYGKEAEIYFPKDYILKPSDGKWTLPQSLRVVLDQSHLNFDVNLLVGRLGVGSRSNASCIVESASKTVDQGLGIELVEIYISNLNQSFSDLENLNITYGYDSNNNPLIFSQKIISSLSNILVNPSNRGLKYRGYVENSLGEIIYPGDPVVISGGLQSGDSSAAKAVAYVGNVTSGSLTAISIANGGYGYRQFPNTVVKVINDPTDLTGTGANVVVQAIDTVNAVYVILNTDAILYKANATLNSANFAFANVANSNINTIIGSAFTFANIETGPIISMNVVNGGGGYTALPSLNLASVYYTDFVNDLSAAGQTSAVANNVQSISDLGYIFHVNVIQPGSGYSNTTDKIVVPSAIGYGAVFDFITNGAGSITSVIVQNKGEGYISLPENLLIVNSVNIQNTSAGSNAIIQAYGFGQGAVLNVAVNQIGQITDFRIITRGFDYVATPNISLRIADLQINPIANNVSFDQDGIIYQGANVNTASWKAYVDSYNVISSILRVYNYQGIINVGSEFITSTVNCTINVANANAVTIYGNGLAKANAIFLNGLIKYPGFYMTTDGFLSSDQYLQDSNTYHNFSYVIVVEKALLDYKNTLMQLVHPAGTSMLGKYSIISENKDNYIPETNVSIIPVTAGNITINAYSTGVITGSGTNFGIIGNVGDLIVFNTSDSSRYLQTKLITGINNANSINVESNSLFVFENLVNVSNGANTIIGNYLYGNVAVSDIVSLNVSGNLINSIVQTVSANTLTVNTIFASNSTNLVMLVYPYIVNASYSIVRNAT